MPRRTKYEDLVLLPTVAAEFVCARQYEGKEWSSGPSQSEIAEIETKRLAMTPEAIREFADLCDARCKAAYEANTVWFQRIIDTTNRGDGTRGRDMLYNILAHWMTSYLTNPDGFRRWKQGSWQVQPGAQVRRLKL
jgi:hypothetical protein